ncbi:MaoC family dehydratase [Vogesella sp. LIG4]|uniref:MaoC family dehydratase n=1 Tax=Vogesella sp. LIG4 TaxID=1192162 RepID=UPI00081F936E|nr:MaoC family dehydratase [Vogesella sp. LIG4]SCK25202.1 Acyl dehydratase [Vogesella sp. LIG4]
MLYFEDLTPGLRFTTDSTTVQADDIHAFASQFDPQYFHLDDGKAQGSIFQGLAASGWHTSSLSMRLVVESEFGRSVAGGLVGMGVDKMRWPRPTRAGDILRASIEVLSGKSSASQPDYGVVKLRWTTHNQHQQEVMSLETAIWVPLRQPAAS